MFELWILTSFFRMSIDLLSPVCILVCLGWYMFQVWHLFHVWHMFYLHVFNRSNGPQIQVNDIYIYHIYVRVWASGIDKQETTQIDFSVFVAWIF